MNYRVNYYVLLFDATVYSVFFALWNVNTIIPLFLERINSPAWTIGAASALKQVCFLLPQLAMASALFRCNSLTGFIRVIISFDRPQLLIFLAFLLLGNNDTVKAMFFITFGIFCLGEGLIYIPWMELLSKTVKATSRGHLFGSVQFWSGIISLGLGIIVSLILNNSRFSFPLDFTIIFGIGSIIMLPSIFFFKTIAEPVLPKPLANPGLKSSVLSCLNNRNFLLVLIVEIFIGAGNLAVPYYILMVTGSFRNLYYMTGTYVFLNIAGSVFGGILWGYLSDKKGNRLTIIILSLTSLISTSLFLASRFIPENSVLVTLLGLGFVSSGIISGGWLGFTNYILESADFSLRPFYMALNNTALLPAALLPIAGGIIREKYGDIRLCLAAAVFTAAALFLSLRLKEPRTWS